jgi:cell pole-organizing protein PopZ
MTSTDPSRDQPPLATAGPPAAAGDPSMEDILASIRRILSEDEPAAPAQLTGNGATDDDVLVLDASMMVPDSNMPAEAESQPADANPVHAEPVRNVAFPAPQPAAEPARAPQPESLRDLLAPEAAAAAASSVGSLVRTIVAERSMQVYSGGPTIEDIVRAEVRPLLAQWLDENLPPMVERLVRSELERVVGRATS